MKFLTSLLVLPLAALCAAQDGSKADEAQNFLRTASEKAKRIRFVGTRRVTISRGGKTETFLEYITKDGSYSRVEFEKGTKFEGQIIVESPTLRKHFFPDRNEVREAPFFSRKQFEGMRMSRGEKPVLADGGEIAGLPTTKATFFGPGRKPVYEVYIHQDSGLTLKRVMFAPSGEATGTFEFQKVVLNPKISKRVFELNPRGATVVRPIDDLRRAAKELKIPLIGFSNGDTLKLDFAGSREIKGQKVLVQNYASADSRITLFVMSDSVNPTELARTGRRPGGVYAWKAFGQTLMLAGELPAGSLEELSKRVGQLGN